MFSRTLSVSKAKFLHFCRDRDGSLAPVFALMLTPMLIAVGASVDYSRANSIKSTLQATLDAAVLAGAKAGVTSGGSDWSQLAQNIFQSNLAAKTSMAATPTFTANNDGTYAGSVTGSVPTSLLGIINIHSLNVTANATAAASAPDDLHLDPRPWPTSNPCLADLERGAHHQSDRMLDPDQYQSQLQRARWQRNKRNCLGHGYRLRFAILPRVNGARYLQGFGQDYHAQVWHLQSWCILDSRRSPHKRGLHISQRRELHRVSHLWRLDPVGHRLPDGICPRIRHRYCDRKRQSQCG